MTRPSVFAARARIAKSGELFLFYTANLLAADLTFSGQSRITRLKLADLNEYLAAKMGLKFTAGEFDAYVQGSAVYQGDSWSDLIQSIRDIFGKQPSYTIADFSAGVERNGLSLELYVKNAFDERARLWTFAGCVESVCGINPYYVTNQPRTIGLKFGQAF